MPGRGDQQRRPVCCVHRGLGGRHRPCRPGSAAARLLHRTADAGRAQERGADGGRYGAGARRGAAPVAAALRRRTRRGRTRRCWRRCVGWCCRRSSAAVRSRRGSSTTPGFPRRAGIRSGVTRQYCGQLGKQDNCQVAVTLSVANEAASLPVAYRLYLPEEWAEDPVRRRKAGVPEDVGFQTKPEIALDADPRRAGGRPADGRGADGRRLRRRHRAAHGDQRAGPALCRRHPAAPRRSGPRHRAAAAEALVRARPAAEPVAPRREHRPIQVKAAGARPAGRGLADGHLARGLGRLADLALRPRCGCAPPIATTGSSEAAPRGMAAGRVAARTRTSRPSIGSRPCPRTSPSSGWSTWPSCAGGSSGIIRNSSRNSASATTRGAGGGASTTTPPSASPPTASWSPSGRRFPPQDRVPPRSFAKPAVPEGYRPRGAADPARTPHPELDRHPATPPHRRPRQEPRPMSVLPPEHASRPHPRYDAVRLSAGWKPRSRVNAVRFERETGSRPRS